MALKAGSEIKEVCINDQNSGASGTVAWWRAPSLRWLTTFLVVVFPFATLFVNRGDSYTLGLLVLVGAWAWIRLGARRWLNRDSASLWIVCAVFFSVVLLSYMLGTQTDAGFRFLGRYLRFLLVVPVYLALRRYPPSVKTAFIGLALGALFGGGLALVKFMHSHDVVREAASTNLSIIFGDLSATMVLGTVAGFGIMAASRRKWTIPLLALCIAGGMAATLLSGTRGAWVAFLFLLLLLATRFGGFIKARYVALILAVMVLAFGASYLVPRTATRARLGLISVQVHDYFASLNTFAPHADPGTGHARCLDSQSFLAAWVAAGRLVGDVRAGVSVVPDASLREAATRFDCSAGYAVRVQNIGGIGAAQYVFPRVPPEAARTQDTTLLARGAAVISFPGSGGHHASVNAAVYAAVAVSAAGVQGRDLNVFVGPGETVWLVPLESYFGEYSFAPADTNVGQRLEMWRAAWRLFLRHPLLGVGMGAYQAQTRELIRRHDIAPFVATFDHPASDYLNALASAGIVGFLALLAVLLVPLLRFARALSSRDAYSHAIGLAGALTVIGFAIYALTDTVFLHSMMITWYLIYMALFYALLDVRADGVLRPEPKKR